METKRYLKLRNDTHLNIYVIMNIVHKESTDRISNEIYTKYMRKYWGGFGMNDRVGDIIDKIIKEYEDE